MKIPLERLKWKNADKALLILCAIFVFSLPLLTPRIYSSDEIEYYVYLRSLYKDGDLNFQNDYEAFVARAPEEYARSGFTHTFLTLKTPTGLRNNFAPVGCSILWLPWFALADGYVHTANLLGADIPADGFSEPYIKLVVYGSMFYGFLGILLIFSFLRRLFGQWESLISSAVIWLGTPVLYYMYVQAPMSHACSLFIVSLFIWYWHRGIGNLEWKRWLVLGLLLGSAGLVREQNLFFVVILFTEGAAFLWAKHKNKKEISFFKLIRAFAVAGFTSLGVFSLQLITYKIINGHFGPSTLVSRKMHWNSPWSWEVLFNYGHGLFFWTPVLFFAFTGLILYTIKNRFTGTALLIGFLTQVYISGAVGSWHASGSFGHRRFINSSIIFAVGLAFLVSWLWSKKQKILTFALAGIFIFWNVQLIVQFAVKIMDRSRMDIAQVAVNSVTKVPEKIVGITKTFFTSRGDLVKQKYGLKSSEDEDNNKTRENNND